MKAISPKTRSSNSHAHSLKPFFNKTGEGTFFSNAKEKEQPFFSPSFIQPKLTIGQPNDKYEQEADVMADKVMSMDSTTGNRPTNPIPAIQTKCTACEAEEGLRTKLDIQKLDHTPDTGYRYTLPSAVTRSVVEIQGVVGSTPDGIYGVDTKTAVERYQTRLAAIGFYTGTVNGEWNTQTDVAHEAYATGPNTERQSYNCAGFAFKRYTFIGLPATRAIYAGMTNLNDCNDSCPAWHHKFWMWEFDINTEDSRNGATTPTTRDFHTIGGQTDGSGNGPSQVMSKDGGRPIIGPGAPMSFRPLAREPVVQTDGSRHPYYVWNVSNIDQECYCSENLP